MAYQGKFSQPRNTEENIRLKQEAKKREAALAAAKAETAPKDAPVKSAPVKEVPAAKPTPKQEAAPAKKNGKKKKKKANRTITIIFYTFYFLLVAAGIAGILFLRSWLNDYLVTYEASRPTTKCEEIFQANFADPDWKALYAMSGLSDTAYESSDAFADYMEQKVGSAEITYVETSAGLTGGHKYLLKLGNETLGFFTLVDNAPQGAEMPDWQLGQVVLSYAQGESVTIQKTDGITVYVNGVALTDMHTIRIGSTLAEDYLPAGLQGPRIYTQYLDGLMVEPEVTATDADGNPVDVVYDESQDLYIVQTEENTITDELYERVLTTAKTYSLRMIEKASKQELGKYFDSKSETYKKIVGVDPWMQEWFFRSYEWGQESITGYYRHSDTLFSVHVKLPMFVTRTDDSVKEYNVDHSFFFEKQGNAWKCIIMTNVDIQKQTSAVRLTFKSDDSVLLTNMYDEDITSLTAPVVTAPEGKVFAGWFRQESAADGSKTYTLVFTPDADGNITLPAGTKLEPMVLFALFEDA